MSAALLVGTGPTVDARAAAAVVDYYSGAGSLPHGITVGPDGAMWVANNGGSIGRVTTAGIATSFTVAAPLTSLDITAGPDGALWFTNGDPSGGGSIGRITTAGTVTNFTDPSIDTPQGIAAGSDGALWFVNGRHSIGRITTAGMVTNFTDARISNVGGDSYGITAGPDGALWFTSNGSSSIGRITTAGAVTMFTDRSISNPGGITVGPDGALWFVNTKRTGNSSIGRITTVGVVTNFTDPTITLPVDITAGSDGALWFTSVNFGESGGSISRITPSGVVTNFTDPNISIPQAISAGPDGAIWFTNAAASSIGRINTVPSSPRSVAAVPSGNESTTVTWNAPQSSGGSAITGYVVTPYVGGVAQSAWVFNSAKTTARVSGLQVGRTYRFTTAAKNAVGTGEASKASNAMTVGAPGPPAKPTSTKVKSGALKVAFAPPVSNGAAITSYTASCSPANGGVTRVKKGKVAPITVTGLTAGKTYMCTVIASNIRGSGPPSAKSLAVKA